MSTSHVDIAAALKEDLERVGSEDSTTIDITLATETKTVVFSVKPADVVISTVMSALRLDVGSGHGALPQPRVELGGVELDVTCSFEENGVDSGATLAVSIHTGAKFGDIVAALLDVNPHILEEAYFGESTEEVMSYLRRRAVIDRNECIRKWDLSYLGITQMPDIFSDVAIWYCVATASPLCRMTLATVW